MAFGVFVWPLSRPRLGFVDVSVVFLLQLGRSCRAVALCGSGGDVFILVQLRVRTGYCL